MHETPGSQRSVEELEAALLGALDLYFEARLRQIARAPREVGPTVEVFEEARHQLAEAEEELEALHRRTQEIKGSIVDAATGGSEEGSERGKEGSAQGAGRKPPSSASRSPSCRKRFKPWPRRRKPLMSEKRRLKRRSGGRSWI